MTAGNFGENQTIGSADQETVEKAMEYLQKFQAILQRSFSQVDGGHSSKLQISSSAEIILPKLKLEHPNVIHAILNLEGGTEVITGYICKIYEIHDGFRSYKYGKRFADLFGITSDKSTYNQVRDAHINAAAYILGTSLHTFDEETIEYFWEGFNSYEINKLIRLSISKALNNNFPGNALKILKLTELPADQFNENFRDYMVKQIRATHNIWELVGTLSCLSENAKIMDFLIYDETTLTAITNLLKSSEKTPDNIGDLSKLAKMFKLPFSEEVQN